MRDLNARSLQKSKIGVSMMRTSQTLSLNRCRSRLNMLNAIDPESLSKCMGSNSIIVYRINKPLLIQSAISKKLCGSRPSLLQS